MRTVSGYLLKCGLQIWSVFAILQAGLVLANGFIYFLKALFLDLWEQSHVQEKPFKSRGRGVCSSQEKGSYCTLQVFPPINSIETKRMEQRNRKTNIHAVRTSGDKFISSLHCVAKKEKSKRVPELGGRELTDLSPDVLTA